MTIWKFPLATVDEQTIVMPIVNRPLTIQMQNGQPCYWAIVDPASRNIRVTIRTFGTGHPGVADSMNYLGTYQLHERSLVFHVFADGWFESR